MNAIIVGMDMMKDGAVKLYMNSVDDCKTETEIKKADGTFYTNRIGKQCFDVFLSQSGFERYATLGLNAQVLKVFYEKGVAIPVAHKSYNGKYYMGLDDFGMAALLISLKTQGKE